MANYNATPPAVRGNNAGLPRYYKGAKRSIAKLEKLQFDPITELVGVFRKVQEEVARQEAIRDGSIVELNGHGKPRQYYAPTHHALFDKLITVGSKLLEYKYGKVNGNEKEEKDEKPTFVLQLSGNFEEEEGEIIDAEIT